MHIGLIGFGNMGSALIKSFLSHGIATAEELIVTDPEAKKLTSLKKMGIATSTDNSKALSSDILIIAVKPQTFPELAATLKGKIQKNTIVVSIMAGVKIEKIQDLTDHKKVVRVMPNTPALVGAGVTGWYAGKILEKGEKSYIQNLLQSTGNAYELSSEEQIDDFMTVSSCGTGFFYQLFIEWLKASEQFDLPKKELKQILSKTLQGSIRLMESSPDTPEELIKKVASKGGATEAGLEVLSKGKLENLFAKTLKAAYNRSKKLG